MNYSYHTERYRKNSLKFVRHIVSKTTYVPNYFDSLFVGKKYLPCS